MLDINSVTALLILVLPAVVQVLKRLFPTLSEPMVQLLVGAVCLLGVIAVEATSNPFTSVMDFVLRFSTIFLASQVVYDKVYVLLIPKVTSALSGGK